jgi:hypothetical protein
MSANERRKAWLKAEKVGTRSVLLRAGRIARNAGKPQFPNLATVRKVLILGS